MSPISSTPTESHDEAMSVLVEGANRMHDVLSVGQLPSCFIRKKQWKWMIRFPCCFQAADVCFFGHRLLSSKRNQLPKQRAVKSPYSLKRKDIIFQKVRTRQRSCSSDNGSMTRWLWGIRAPLPHPPTSRVSFCRCLLVPERCG